MSDALVNAELDAELLTIKQLLLDALPAITPAAGTLGWPYELVDGEIRPAVRASRSTPAMIGFTLAALLNFLESGDELAGPTLDPSDLELPRHIETDARRGYQCAIDVLSGLHDETKSSTEDTATTARSGELRSVSERLRQVQSDLNGPNDPRSRRARAAVDRLLTDIDEPAPLIRSSLFGDDDPFTLDWMARLCRTTGAAAVAKTTELEALLSRVTDLTERKVANILGTGPEDFRLSSHDHDRQEDGKFVAHVWPILRIAYLTRYAGRGESLDTAEEVLYRYFSNEMAQQLGFSEVRDSSFDVSRLVFALDGVTLCKPKSLNTGLLQRTLDIILIAQKLDPRLQPRQPFKVTPTGGVHIPITVEVFLSLIRIVSRLDASERFATLERLLPVFQRYTAYLEASVVDVKLVAEEIVYRGWASDHEYSTSLKIETWFTSQVVLYLLMYGRVVKEHAASLNLNEVKLRTRPVSQAIPSFFDDQFSAIRDDFKLDAPMQRERWSLLLYGPPGTGKTTIVEQLAQRLTYPLLELSPSHFVDQGVDRVEQRAAQLFRVLDHQSNIVVLFDEIDRLVLDRSSAEYGQQGDMFQFMTPSMLTKLNNLRRAEHVVFAIATNYAWRIDSAILRPGRVDASYLVLPPNLNSRELQIRLALPDLQEGIAHILAQETVLASWTEIKSLCSRLVPEAASLTSESARRASARLSPTIQLQNYDRELSKTPQGKPAEYLFFEIIGLYELLEEASRPIQLPSVHADFIRAHLSLVQSSDPSRAANVQRWI